jgi:hypothetical protein
MGHELSHRVPQRCVPEEDHPTQTANAFKFGDFGGGLMTSMPAWARSH